MTRTPLSIVREARDLRRFGGNCRSGAASRRFSSQLNSSSTERAADAARISNSTRSSQRRLPSLPNPFASRSSKAAADAACTGEQGYASGTWRSGPSTRSSKPEQEPSHCQLSVRQAIEIQLLLRDTFADARFQDALKRLQSKFPHRKDRDHTDGPAFFEAFERLALGVYQDVLPDVGFAGTWDGLCEFYRSTETASTDARVRELQVEINTLLGLPRDVRFNAKRPKDELLSYRPSGDGAQPDWMLLPAPLDVDSDGDEAHEFWVEDLSTGMLVVLKGSTA